MLYFLFFCCFILESHCITGLLWQFITGWFNFNVFDHNGDDVCTVSDLMCVISFHQMSCNLSNIPYVFFAIKRMIDRLLNYKLGDTKILKTKAIIKIFCLKFRNVWNSFNRIIHVFKFKIRYAYLVELWKIMFTGPYSQLYFLLNRLCLSCLDIVLQIALWLTYIDC